MLLSMTGFGEAHSTGPGCTIAVEIRSVNNRHLKLTVRGSEPYSTMDTEIERIVRRTVRRGTITVQIRVNREVATNELRLNTAVLAGYLERIAAACSRAGTPELLPAVVSNVLSLPGITSDESGNPPVDSVEWSLVQQTLETALIRFDSARQDEGQTMADELLGHHATVVERVEQVRLQLPSMMDEYRSRLLEKIRQAMGDAGARLEPDQLIREVALYADRTDVSEELTRLTAHLEQFADVIRSYDEGAGRRLEFIIQEIGRETNTLGSKAGDVTISRQVIEMKATLEKMRELIQNVE